MLLLIMDTMLNRNFSSLFGSSSILHTLPTFERMFGFKFIQSFNTTRATTLFSFSFDVNSYLLGRATKQAIYGWIFTWVPCKFK